MSSPKLLAYKAIIEQATMLQELLKNPDAIKDAYKEYTDGFALSESKKAEAEEALQKIEDAKKQSDALAKDKRDFDEQVRKILESLSQRKNELDVLQSEYEEKQAATDKIIADAKKIKADADNLTKHANSKLFDIEAREKAHAKSLEQLDETIRKFEVEKAQHKISFEAEKAQHKANVAHLAARENKLKEALS
jgi:chromosome segregation ATPase